MSEHILVENNGLCKICSFGNQDTPENWDQNFSTTGSIVYWMAPEVVRSRDQAFTKMANIWSIGCIVLEMWTGERPWGKYSSADVVEKVFQLLA
jgi:mitogen-activated protein kinase kinase kinase